MASERKKVLFLTPSLAGGGAERVFSTLLQHLDRNCFELHLGVLQAKGEYFKDLADDVVVHELGVPRVRYALLSIVRLVWTLRPHTVMSTLRHMNVLLVLSKPFLPRDTRVVIRETAFASLTLKNETDHPRFWSWMYRHLYQYANHVIVLSDAMVRDLVENFRVPRKKIVRIYNPVDSRRVRESAELGASPYSGPGPNLVAAGRFSREKGFDILLSALPAVVGRFPSARLFMLGQGSLRDRLVSQAHALGLDGAVDLVGFQHNPWRYFRHADLFVLPSRYDALPNVLIEALTAGAFAVATDCPGGVREIQACDPTMVLVPPEDPDALSAAIISACDKSMSANGCPERPAPNLGRFDLQQILAEYCKLF